MWNEKKLQQLKADGRIQSYKSATQEKRNNIPQSPAQNIPNKSAAKAWLDLNLQYWCNERALTLECAANGNELKFDTERKWRFDYAIPALMIAVEYEGLFSVKSRHTTAKGFTGDADKYNRAQVLGWRIIRVTALNYKTVLKTLNAYAA